jgi:hypothetical protein
MNTKTKQTETNRRAKAHQAHGSGKQGQPPRKHRGEAKHHEQELIETRMFR